MLTFKERTSSNSPIHFYKSLLGFTVSATFASQLKSVLSLGKREEDIATGLETKEFFTQDVSIWLRSDHDREYYLDVSSNLDDLIAHFFSKVLEINQIYLLKESENIFHVWSVISEKTNTVKKSIYECERELIHYFKESLYFDFHIDVLSDIEYIKSTGASLIFERK